MRASQLTRLADVPKDKFDAALATETERVRSEGGRNLSRTGVLRVLDPEREKRPDERWLNVLDVPS